MQVGILASVIHESRGVVAAAKRTRNAPGTAAEHQKEGDLTTHQVRGERRASEAIPGLPGATLGDFWSWAYGNLLENTVRPAFAEFMVGALLGVDSSSRVVWDSVDLRWRGVNVEVKSAAYVQAWTQKRPSTIQFDIARKYPWDAETNIYGAEQVRSADCYVFCLYPERDEARADPIDVPAWRFWVVPTAQIDAVFGGQKSVALSRIEGLVEAVGAAGLAAAVAAALGCDAPQAIET